MRLWIVNHYTGVPGRPGGTRHYSLARELVQRGHQVVLIASSFAHMQREEAVLRPGEAYKREQIDGVTFLWLRTPPYAGNSIARVWNMLCFAWAVWRMTGLKGLPPPDLILGSSPHLFGALAAQRLAASLRVPFLLEVRDLWPQTFVDLGAYPRWHPFLLGLEAIERFLYRRAERIISLLPLAAAHLEAKGARPSKICWLPNGVDFAAAGWPVPPGGGAPYTLMYAGAHGLANDLSTLLEAAALLEERGCADRIRIRLVGDGPDKPALEQQARKRGLRILQFEPPVPKAQVFPVLQQADGFVLLLKHSPLYRWGSSPNKLFDYLAAGRPVLVCGAGPYDPVAEAGAGISVPASDPGALAGAILRLAEMPLSERSAMGERGRSYAETRHSFTVLADRLEALLLECLGRSAREEEGQV